MGELLNFETTLQVEGDCIRLLRESIQWQHSWHAAHTARLCGMLSIEQLPLDGSREPVPGLARLHE